MKKRTRVAAAFLVGLTTWLQADEIGSYAITQVTTAPGGADQATMKWFVTPEKSRAEMSSQSDSPMGSMVVITRKDKGVVWTLFPAKKAYMESPIGEEQDRAGRLMEGMQADQTVEELGKDELMGYDCARQKVRSKIEVGPRRVETENLIWKCEGFDMPLRVEAKDGSVTETTAINVGAQPDELFEPPADYRKAANVMDLMGGGG
jgi:hypothetical protein